MEYKGSKPTKQGPVLYGQGITFDTGGISKPGANMDEMKYDMGGAASVFGSVKTVCELDLPIHLVVVVAAAETRPMAGHLAPATSSRPCPARPWRSSTPTLKAVWCCVMR